MIVLFNMRQNDGQSVSDFYGFASDNSRQKQQVKF